MSSTSIKPQLMPEFWLIASGMKDENQTSNKKVVSLSELNQKQP